MNVRARVTLPFAGSEEAVWERRLLDECWQTERCGQRFVLILFAVEGGVAGLAAETLDLIGDSLRSDVRQSDVVVRAGPALYAVLLIGSDPEFGLSVAERLVSHVRADAGSLVRELTERPLRFGVASFNGDSSVEATIAEATRDLLIGRSDPAAALAA